MVKNFIILFCIFSLIGCKHQNENDKQPIIDTLDVLTKTNWNIDLNNMDTMSVYAHSALQFDKDYAYFHNEQIGSYELINDSLIVKEVYYQQSADSFIRKEKLKLIAKIEKIDNDSLIIEKIKGRGFYFVSNKTYKYFPNIKQLKFYNDTSLLLKQTNFEKISLSSSLCYGNCPSQAVEILSNGEYKFYGGKYSELDGYYLGRMSASFIDSLKYLLSAAIVNRDNLSNVPPIDAPVCDIKICFSNQDTLKIHGCPSHFPVRLGELYSLLMFSYRKAEIIKINNQIDFITNSHIYDTTELIPPSPPPDIVDMYVED